MTKHLLAGVAAVILTAGVLPPRAIRRFRRHRPIPRRRRLSPRRLLFPAPARRRPRRLHRLPTAVIARRRPRSAWTPTAMRSPERMFTGKVSAAARKPTRKPRLTHLAGPQLARPTRRLHPDSTHSRSNRRWLDGLA